jgi:hypothetical protein
VFVLGSSPNVLRRAQHERYFIRASLKTISIQRPCERTHKRVALGLFHQQNRHTKTPSTALGATGKRIKCPLNSKPADVGHDGAGLAGAVFAGELALIGDGAMLRAIRRAWVYGFAAKMKILLAGMAGWPAADFFIQIEQRHLALHGLGVSDLANQAARRRGRHGWWPLSHWLARLCAGWFQISPGLAWLSAPADAPCR